MHRRLRYGAAATLDLEVPAGALVAECARSFTPIADLPRAVREAVHRPLGFPDLALAVTPGDRVCLALEDAVPDCAIIAATLIEVFVESRVSPPDICVLLGSGSAEKARRIREAIREVLGTDTAQAIEITIHDPEDRSNLSYLAATEIGEPIYLHRALVEADVVVPVGTVRLAESLDYLGVHGGLFPVFSDAESICRFRAPLGFHIEEEQARRKAECDEAAWLLGVMFAVQVVPGPADSVLFIVAGATREVERRGQRYADDVWTFRTPRRADLVVATIAGGPEHQSWLEVARAASAASAVATDDGVIVLCTELQRDPEPVLRILTDDHLSRDQVRRRIRRDRSLDAIAADTLARICERTHVFLLSGLASDVVENVGLGYVAEPGEIQRLCDAHRSCILLPDAHRALVHCAEAHESSN